MPDIEYVRVRDEAGDVTSVPRKKYDMRPGRYELVDGPAADQGGNPLPEVSPAQMPAKNAPTDEWRAYGSEHGLSPDEVADMNRDALVAHFTKES